MSCLGEEVEGLDLSDLVAVFEKALEVPHLGGGVARDVDHFAGAVVEELGEEVFAAALARGVDDDGGFLCLELDVGEEFFGGGSDELGVLDTIGLGIPAGPVGRGFGKLDADDFFKVLGEAEGEESGAAVGIEEVALAFSGGFFCSVGGEGGEDEGIVLEEVSGEEVELEVADLFGDGVPVVGLYAAIGRAEEEGGPFFIGAGIVSDFLAGTGEVGIDLIHRDGAMGDIENERASVVLEEADGVGLAVLGLLKMGGDF